MLKSVCLCVMFNTTTIILYLTWPQNLLCNIDCKSFEMFYFLHTEELSDHFSFLFWKIDTIKIWFSIKAFLLSLNENECLFFVVVHFNFIFRLMNEHLKYPAIDSLFPLLLFCINTHTYINVIMHSKHDFAAHLIIFVSIFTCSILKHQ